MTMRVSQFNIPTIAIVTLSIAVSAAVSYEPVRAPVIYRTNPDVQLLATEKERGQQLNCRHRELINARYQTVVAAAEQLAQPDARREFLEKALVTARLELAGHQNIVNIWQGQYERLNSPLKRLFGNELLNCTALELERSQAVMDISERHVERIDRMFQPQRALDSVAKRSTK